MDTNPFCETYDKFENSVLNDEHYTIYSEGEILGAVVLKIANDSRIHIYKLFVKKNQQGKGIGTKTINLAEDIYQDYKLWSVYTPNKNYLNHAFYESLGFQKYDEAKVSENLVLYKFKKEIS
ncbi:GNAT family N-acetyltransferase [Macrococcoides canis]|uniref:GNAT family N-acetyltransferase n=1 Tax=Macrococcoides canis TaxID=1855823 RepID=UPI0010FBD501|nr:GNAT family N-acetyltransferase [Macrococcus canis]QCT75663.1 N-acetyltransferase [Macrococcus canis]